MKKNLIFSGCLALLLSPSLVSCGSDYLDEAPRTDVSAATVNASEEGAKAAVTGLARQMQRQFDDLKNGNLNASGETFFANLYGEGLSADCNVGEISNYGASACDPARFRNGTGWWGAWMYRYAYSIIGSANSILANIPGDNLSDVQYWLKGCSLTMRAHCYWRLMQVYGPRWADAKNGDEYCLVMRLDSGGEIEHPLNTCKEVYDQMYADLEEAIECFKKTTIERGDNLYYPDLSVAQGTLARLAMLKNDYATAQKMAHDARQGYPIMTGEQYQEGFSKVNQEWIWAPCMDPLGTWYWNYGPHYACNGHYSSVKWGYSNSMDYALYRHFSPTDARARLYFGPLVVDFEPEMAQKYGITKEDFYSTDVAKATKWNISLTSTGASPKGKNLKMWQFIQEYGNLFLSMRPVSISPIYGLNTKGLSLGVNYKFQGLDDGYTSCWPPYMRAGEMLLTEAEAAYHNNDMATVKSCLEELMAKRDPNYTVPTGDLLDEVKLQRRIELWGEGFSWFDYKRWNTTLARKEWNPEDLDNCGGWPKTLLFEFTPDWMHGWRAAIPEREFTLNKAANSTLVGL